MNQQSNGDIYQERYLKHQAKKKKELSKDPEKVAPYYPKEKKDFDLIVKNRKSRRIYSDEPISDKEMAEMLKYIEKTPSSCDRHGVDYTIVEKRDEKALLSGLLVGGVGWIHRADKIILLWADPKAYKEKLLYMPFLDAGVMTYHLYLMAERMNFGYCFVNPNVREEHQELFEKTFGNKIFCGAFAVGKLK